MYKAKYICLIILYITCISYFVPKNVYALSDYVQLAETAADQACNNNDACTNATGVFGSVDCECSTAWLLQKILNYMRIIAPTLVAILSSIDYAKAVITSDEEDMKKVQKKLITRLILCVVLFIIPTIVELLLNVFGLISTGESVTQGIK